MVAIADVYPASWGGLIGIADRMSPECAVLLFAIAGEQRHRIACAVHDMHNDQLGFGEIAENRLVLVEVDPQARCQVVAARADFGVL